MGTAEVLETMESKSANFKKLIMSALPEFPEGKTCDCVGALRGALY